LFLSLTLGLALRTAFAAADPPRESPVSLACHDGAAWLQTRGNRALWQATDRWNPVFLASVFTGLEGAVFEPFGVGLRQLREWLPPGTLVQGELGVIRIVPR
jgi:hypothetical protein